MRVTRGILIWRTKNLVEDILISMAEVLHGVQGVCAYRLNSTLVSVQCCLPASEELPCCHWKLTRELFLEQGERCAASQDV